MVKHRNKRLVEKTESSEKTLADPGEVGGLKFAAYALVVAVFLGMVSFNAKYFENTFEGLPNLGKLQGIEFLNFVAPLVLFIGLVFLIFWWIIATQHEFDLWKTWLKNPFTPLQQKIALIAFPVVLGILPAFPNHITFISGLMALYSFLNYWTQWLCNDHFSRALRETKMTNLDRIHARKLAVMELYWLRRPQLARIVTMTFFNSIAFGLALAGAGQQEPQRHRFQLSAYALLILVLLCGEIVITWWRFKREQAMQEITKVIEPQANDFLEMRQVGGIMATRKKNERSSMSENIGSIMLAFLPFLSFLCQYLLSIQAGTRDIFFRHLTVMVVDWVFVPFNFFVVRAIEWRDGSKLYIIMCISVVFNLVTHAYWQYSASDLGHMITKGGVVLPAGWVHLGFSIMQTGLLAAFVFCRKADAPGIRIITILATIYFLMMGICGYAMHKAFIISDVVVSICGLFFVLFYPHLVQLRKMSK